MHYHLLVTYSLQDSVSHRYALLFVYFVVTQLC